MKRRYLRNHILIVMAVMTLAAIGCSKKEENAGPPPGMSTNVVGFKTEARDVEDKISVVGTLEANESIDIITEVNGTIERILCEEGQAVRKGDVLFEIDRNKLQTAYDQAVADLKLAETTAQRYENLVKSKAVSQQEYDQTVATLESARAAKIFAQEQLNDATIKAPFDGVMGERLVSEGQFTTQGKLLSFLFNQNPMKIKFNVPERYLNDVKVGQLITMNFAAFKDREFQGKVYFVDRKVSEKTRTILVKAYVDNPDGILLEGMFANVDLVFDVKKGALVIPETALIIKGDEVLVYVVGEDQAVQIRPVKVGKRFDGMVVIDEGLSVEETVVTEGYQKIGPGSPVNVRFEDPSERKVYEII
ncbi:MAG: efflux RND transporter periplasmic adaptor subunit [Candidatus Omnitrophica bacterium]|nr:efflux RND transporter periplasmic adaptor subunit [Candidatus Omnitrophota bacterium]